MLQLLKAAEMLMFSPTESIKVNVYEPLSHLKMDSLLSSFKKSNWSKTNKNLLQRSHYPRVKSRTFLEVIMWYWFNSVEPARKDLKLHHMLDF